MEDEATKKINNWFNNENNDLSKVLAKAKQLQLLNEQVSQHLEKNMLPYCHVANLVGNKLIMIAANGSIATQIRFQALDLIRKFKQVPALKHIQEIECKVRPGQSRSASSPIRTMPAISGDTAETIRQMAASIEDPKLREIMERIASRTVKPQPK